MKEIETVTKSLFQRIKIDRVILANAGSLVGTTAVTSGLGFVYWWLAARQNSPEAVGLASAAISAMTLLAVFGMMGLGTLLIGELSRQRGKEASLISAALILVGGVGGCLGILYALFAPFLSTDFQALGGNIQSILLFALGVSLTSITLVLDQALIGLLRGELQLWRNTLFATVKLLTLFAVGLWLSHVTGLTIYMTWIIGSVFSLVVLALFAITRRTGPWRSYLPQWKLLRQLGPAALKHHALNLTLQAPSLVLPVLVTIMLSTTATAWFYVAWNLSSIANAVSAALASTLYAVSSARPSVLASKLRLTVSLAFVACVLVNSVLIVAPKQALELFGHNYSEQAAWSLRILSLESLPFIVKNHYIALSRIRGQVTRTILVTIGTGLLELGGSAAGAHFGGLNGLSLGWFSAMCIEAICMSPVVYAAARSVKVSAEEQVSLDADAMWLRETIVLPAEQRSLGAQTVWLLDTLALTAIRPGIVESDTLHLQRVEPTTLRLKAQRLPRNEHQVSSPGHGRNRLKPTRLERFSPSIQEAGEEDRQEDEYTDLPFVPTD